MPYRRKRFKRRYNKTKKQIYKNKRKIKMLSKAMEMKIKDVSDTMPSVDTSGEVLFLADIDQFQAGGAFDAAADSKFNTRIGNSVLARKLKIRGYIANTSGTAKDGILRLIVLRWKTQMSSNLTIGAVLGNYEDPTAVSSTVNTFLNPDYSAGFDIISDTTFAYDTNQYSQIPFKIVKKLNSVIEWQDETGPYNTCQKNGLWIMALTNQGTTADAPDIVLESRLSYIDA